MRLDKFSTTIRYAVLWGGPYRLDLELIKIRGWFGIGIVGYLTRSQDRIFKKKREFYVFFCVDAIDIDNQYTIVDALG